MINARANIKKNFNSKLENRTGKLDTDKKKQIEQKQNIYHNQLLTIIVLNVLG